MTVQVCQQHQAPAGWRCRECGELLCPDCSAMKQVYPSEFPGCSRCGGAADVLTVHRRDRGSLAARLPEAFLWPVRRDGLLLLAGVALLWTLTSLVGIAQLTFGVPGIILSLFSVVRSTAHGREHPEAAEFLDLFQGILGPLLRLFLVFVPLWVPAALYLWTVGWVNASAGVLWLLTALGAAWMPAAFLVAATDCGLTTLLNPFAIVGISLKLGRSWAVYAGTWAVLLVVWAVLAVAGVLLLKVPIPFFVPLLANMALFYAPFVGARVAGLALFLHGDDLGWGMPQDYLLPQLGDAQPRGTLPEGTGAGMPAVRSYAPIELSDDAPAAPVSRMDRLEPRTRPAPEEVDRAAAALTWAQPPGPPARPQSLDASALPPLAVAGGDEDDAPEARKDALDVAALPSLGALALERLKASIAKGDAEHAVEEFRTAADAVLSCGELTWLGRAAAARGDDALARQALERAVAVGGAAGEVSKAMVTLGRLCAERLGDAPAGREWMERCAREFPSEPAAKFAAEWLAARPAAGTT